MNATAYLETLIRHVVSEMEFLSESPAARCARERVEAAAAALVAMGLLPSDDVTAFGERVDAAMEASGLIRRISIEQSVSASVDAAGRRPADQRAKHARRRLEGVLPIAVESQLADDGRLVMLSVNRWNVGFDVMFALLDQAAGVRDALRDEWQWTVHDDDRAHLNLPRPAH